MTYTWIFLFLGVMPARWVVRLLPVRVVGALFAGIIQVLTSMLVLCLVHRSPLKETRQRSHSVEASAAHSFSLIAGRYVRFSSS